MSQASLTNAIPLDAEYYLFGVYFTAEVDSETNEKTFPNWHAQTSLIDNQEITNVRPLARVPLINITDSDKPQLWAAGQDFTLSKLNSGQPAEGGVFEALKPESPIHTLGSSIALSHDDKSHIQKYTFRFPPLPLMASLADLSEKELSDKIAQLSGKLENSQAELTLTDISPAQLAPPYQPDASGQLTPDQQTYNDWHQKVSEAKKPIQGFVVPVVASCAVVFSDKGYVDATVSLYKFQVTEQDGTEVGDYVQVGDSVQAALPKNIDQEDAQQYPCALFHLDPAEFEQGLYSIRVEFIPSNMKAEVPDFIQQANIESYEDGADTIFTYELREKITFSPQTPLGQFAIVSGDMISLEESLMYQYPQYFSEMKHYLTGNPEGNAATTPAARSLVLLKNIRDASAQLGAGLMSGSLQQTLNTDGRQAVFNNISKLYWDAVKSDMPEVMKAAGELYYGLYSTADAYQQLKNLHNPTLANLGWKALFTAKVFDRQTALATAVSTAMEARLGNHRVVAGRVAQAWFSGGATLGLTGVGTISSGIDLYTKGKAVLAMAKKAQKAKQSIGEVAYDYLDKIPVWNTSRESQQQGIEQALEKARADAGDEITATMVNNERGAGIKIEFSFNSRESELEQNEPVFRQLATALAEVLKSETNLRVEIEGHACQVDTEEINMKVAAERANYAKQLLLECSEVFKDKISLAVFGESKPLYIPKKGETVDRNNPNLRQNRRVEIRMYLPSLDVLFHPSRYGSQAMERSRLALETTMTNEDKAEVELRMAIFEGIVDVASYIPVIAPVARGVLLAKESGKALISAVKCIDNAFLDSFLTELNQKHDLVRELERLSKIHLELLAELRNTNTKLEQTFHSYKDLVDFLDSEEAQKELLKRYQLRALAMNGLILLLADLGMRAKHRSDGNFKHLVERYKVKQYIEQYILSDHWSVNTIKGTTLAADWKNRCDDEYYADIEKNMPEGSMYAPLPRRRESAVGYYPYSYIPKQTVPEATGAFNRVFPVQTSLYDHPQESMFDNFAKSFNPQVYELKQEAIGFCRILIQSARKTPQDKPKWLAYQDWISQADNEYVGPYDKVKVQIILKKQYDSPRTVTIGCDRVDGYNIQGPAFSDWMLPMKVSEFKHDLNGDIKAYYAKQGLDDDGTLIAIEHIPSYRFGEVMIDGLKPITSKARLLLTDTLIGMVASADARGYNANYNYGQTDSFTRYVESGGFRNMRYSLAVRQKDGKSGFHLPIEFVEGQESRDEDELQVGVLTETKSVLLKTSVGEHYLQLREKDVLIESFTLRSEEGNKNTVPVLSGIKQQVVAIETKASGLNFFNQRKWYDSADNIHRDGFSWGNRGKQDPAAIYMLLLGENIAKDIPKLDWQSVNMCMQLGLDGNEGDMAKGPIYYTQMHHVGEFKRDAGHWAFNEAERADTLSDMSLMRGFLDQAVKNLKTDNDLSRAKEYAVYCMRFELGYISPTGVNLKGLRPFGKVIGGKYNLELSVAHLKQVGLAGGEDYDKNRDLVISIPSLRGDTALAGNYFENMPWLVEKESSEEGVDKSAAETWKKYDKAKRKKWLKDWIENQPTKVLAPYPLEKSLDNPN
ncbi:OmpA family protein [Vibrio aquimaris]|jgi:outer membrane protein OmpA-like peptidoglycan-associated protein|uniref:Peptidoglycan-associated outer membrane lipoprotein n=1 Tax=Vibrio aquimaris TaxID=2587862 RepID=A0A5P9CRV9_9VIBR|nr:OmpA family protein [Vibrio aquimaris]QFT28713.1 peptidoglycan-associated outer membrane lipoprotein [Vibrio aquimaris]